MKRLFARFCSLLAALGMTACGLPTEPQFTPGVSTGAEVRQRMGTPTMEWRNDDGSVTWEFARTPEGTRNYMATVGADGILREFTQVVTEQNFARVSTGMDKDAVRRLLGRPKSVVLLDLKHQEVWDWPYPNPFLNTDMRFNVHFGADGRVQETSRSEEMKGG